MHCMMILFRSKQTIILIKFNIFMLIFAELYRSNGIRRVA